MRFRHTDALALQSVRQRRSSQSSRRGLTNESGGQESVSRGPSRFLRPLRHELMTLCQELMPLRQELNVWNVLPSAPHSCGVQCAPIGFWSWQDSHCTPGGVRCLLQSYSIHIALLTECSEGCALTFTSYRGQSLFRLDGRGEHAGHAARKNLPPNQQRSRQERDSSRRFRASSRQRQPSPAPSRRTRPRRPRSKIRSRQFSSRSRALPKSASAKTCRSDTASTRAKHLAYRCRTSRR